MPGSRYKVSELGAGLVLFFGILPAALAADAAWFGSDCGPDVVAVVPVGHQELLVSVITEPGHPGENDTLLRTPDGEIWVTPESLQHWRAPVPKTYITYDGRRWISLREITDLRYRFDSCTQTLWVDTASATRTVTRRDVLPRVKVPEGRARIEPGGYLNLDTQLLRFADTTQWSGIGELGAFNGYGYGATSFVANRENLIRLETAWSVDDPESLHRLRLGDAITRSSNFGQSVRIGGVQWGRQFSLRPDIITYPLPSFRGSAALASSVDVYVNQSLRSSQEVPSGPFELNRIPVIAGRGEVQLVVRDVLGREQWVSYPFYAAPILLREGLTDYTVEAGWLRNNYSLTSADYGRFLAATTYRKGLSDTLTAEVHHELLHEQQLLAVSGVWLQPALGVFSAGLAGSGAANGLGGGVQLGFERITRVWNLAAEIRRASPRFIRAGDGLDTVRHSELARIGFVPHIAGSVSLNYLRQRREASGKITILGLSYTYGFARRWNLFVNATQVTSQTRDYNLLIGLNWQFGQNLLASSEFTHDGHSRLGRVTVQKTMESALDYSLRASAETGVDARRQIQAQWAQERGTLSADAERVAGNNNYRLGYTTGFALLGTDVFWTRPVDGSFAVVDTQGVPDVRIYTDERVAGRTDQNGKLLVPNLRTYEITQLRIEDSDVPIEFDMGELRQPLFLPTRGGTRVRFTLSATRGLTLKLLLKDGAPVPVGAQVTVPGLDQLLPVGFEGKVYLAQAPKQPRLEARWGGHRCVAQWPVATPDAVEALCVEITP